MPEVRELIEDTKPRFRFVFCLELFRSLLTNTSLASQFSYLPPPCRLPTASAKLLFGLAWSACAWFSLAARGVGDAPLAVRVRGRPLEQHP